LIEKHSVDHEASTGNSLILFKGTTRLKELPSIQMVRPNIIITKYYTAMLHPPVWKVEPRSDNSNISPTATL
jgi:hypothetical protein